MPERRCTILIAETRRKEIKGKVEAGREYVKKMIDEFDIQKGRRKQAQRRTGLSQWSRNEQGNIGRD